jgi:cephalosporin hydroxylase
LETVDLVKKALELGAIQVPEEISALVELLKKQRLRHVMEIGSEAGGTFYLWCRLTAIGGLKISLDLPNGASGSGRFRDASALARRTTLFKRWSANVHVVTGDSHEQNSRREVEEALAGNKLDFLFIDGDHSYEGVKADFEDYKGFVRPGGLIAFHDIVDSEFHRKRGCHVAKFWTERFSRARSCTAYQYNIAEFHQGLEWGGIGVVTV